MKIAQFVIPKERMKDLPTMIVKFDHFVIPKERMKGLTIKIAQFDHFLIPKERIKDLPIMIVEFDALCKFDLDLFSLLVPDCYSSTLRNIAFTASNHLKKKIFNFFN